VRTWIRSEEDEGKYEEYEDIIKELDPPLMAVLPLVIGREDETLGRPSSSQAPSHVLQNRFGWWQNLEGLSNLPLPWQTIFSEDLSTWLEGLSLVE